MQKLFHNSQEKWLLLRKFLGMNFTFLKQTSSTNAFLLEKPELERVDSVVWTAEQTAGKGMGTNVWESEPGKNLTFSLGVDMSFMKASDQFLLSQAVPLALLDVLDTCLPSDALTVKWPNDLYYGNRKLCGILINSTIHDMMMGVSVVGVGLNVNQMQFRDWPTHPISMKMILGDDVELDLLLARLVGAILKRVQLLKTVEGVERVKKDYLCRLYRYRVWSDFEVEGTKVKRFITGIDPFGRLQTLDESGQTHTNEIKEIQFL